MKVRIPQIAKQNKQKNKTKLCAPLFCISCCHVMWVQNTWFTFCDLNESRDMRGPPKGAASGALL